MFRTRKTVRNEKEKTSFSYGLRAKRFVVSLPKGQLARPEGIILCDFFSFSESNFKNGRDGSVQQPDLGLRRLLQPSWAQVSAGRMWGEVSSSVLRSGVSSAARELSVRPSSEWVCLHLRGFLWVFFSSFFSVFVCLCVRRYLFNE